MQKKMVFSGWPAKQKIINITDDDMLIDFCVYGISIVISTINRVINH